MNRTVATRGIAEMPPADRLELIEIALRYGNVIDDRDWSSLGEIFSDDVEFDITDFAGGVTRGLDALVDLMSSPTARHPVAHLVANVEIQSLSGDEGTMRSRLIAVQSDGSVFVGAYRDEVKRTDAGWRIRRRVCSYIRRP